MDFLSFTEETEFVHTKWKKNGTHTDVTCMLHSGQLRINSVKQRPPESRLIKEYNKHVQVNVKIFTEFTY